MQTRIPNLYRDERGMSLVFVGLGFTAFVAATTLAIDVGMFMTARSQAQNAADAGALAGAVALVYNSYTDRSAGGPAVQSAVNAAAVNKVIGAAPSVGPADVAFLNDPSGQPNRVQAQVYRTTTRGNAVPTMMGALFGVQTVNITALAVAEAAPANAETCVKPFTIPDKWTEHTTPPWDTNDTFDMYDNKGKPLANPDTYVTSDQPGYTGYDPDRDKGLRLVLKANNQSKVAPSFYNPWDLPGSQGASDYRDNIANCNSSKIPIGDPMTAEPGNMVGPTAQGTSALIAKDPNAYWDTGCNCVKGSAFGISPRVVVIPLYDPVYYETGKQNGRNASLKIANYLGFFIEQMQGNEVMGRITPITGVIDPSAGPAPAGAFPKAIRLIQ